MQRPNRSVPGHNHVCKAISDCDSITVARTISSKQTQLNIAAALGMDSGRVLGADFLFLPLISEAAAYFVHINEVVCRYVAPLTSSSPALTTYLRLQP